jgi:hypothetical protein
MYIYFRIQGTFVLLFGWNDPKARTQPLPTWSVVLAAPRTSLPRSVSVVGSCVSKTGGITFIKLMIVSRLSGTRSAHDSKVGIKLHDAHY